MGFNGGGSSSSIAGGSDVGLNNVANNNILSFDTATAKWKNTAGSRTGTAPIGQDELFINVLDHGLDNNSQNGNTQALTNLINALPVVGDNAMTTLYFPAGTYTFGGNIIFNKTITIRGDGENTTVISRTTDASGDLFTFNAKLSTIRDLTINSHDSQTTSGDDIVFNASYARAQNLYLTYSGGTAIRIGKAVHSIAFRLDQILVRAPKEHCVWVTGDSDEGSTDGIWSNCDFGTAGLSAVRIESSAQNMSNIHAWGSGTLKNDSDSSGFLLASSASHLITNCQAETNWGHGFSFLNGSSKGTIVTGSKSWRNGRAGFAATLYDRLSLIGWVAYDNGIRNPLDGNNSDLYVGVRNLDSNYMSLIGGKSFDNEGSATIAAPSPAMSRGAVATQLYDYVEITSGSGPLNGINNGNDYSCTNGVKLATAGSGKWEGNSVLDETPTLASASMLPIRANHGVVIISGSATISTIAQGKSGQRILLKFLSTATVSSSPSLKLTQTFAASANAYLELLYDGSRWVETARG